MKRAPRFDVRTEVQPGEPPTRTVSVVGEFDASEVATFDQAVADALDAVAEITIDLTGTTIIDSSALGALVRLCARADEASIAYATVVTHPFQLKLLQVTGLMDVLNVAAPEA